MNAIGNLNKRPLYLVVITHVEGDETEPVGSPTYEDLTCQEGGLPPIGEKPRCINFEVDLVGTEFLHEFLQNYTARWGRPQNYLLNRWAISGTPK
jgi:hypothetical protein